MVHLEIVALPIPTLCCHTLQSVGRMRQIEAKHASTFVRTSYLMLASVFVWMAGCLCGHNHLHRTLVCGFFPLVSMLTAKNQHVPRFTVSSLSWSNPSFRVCLNNFDLLEKVHRGKVTENDSRSQPGFSNLWVPPWEGMLGSQNNTVPQLGRTLNVSAIWAL